MSDLPGPGPGAAVREGGGGTLPSGAGGSGGGGGGGGGERAVPYVCPFCGEEDLRPAPSGRWHCRSCLRLFTVTFHGVEQPASSYPAPAYTTAPPTPASGIRLTDVAAARAADLGDDDPDDDAEPSARPSTPGSPR